MSVCDHQANQPVSPLGWSVLRRDLEDIAFREPLRLLGVDPDELGPITRLWHGHPYVNVAAFIFQQNGAAAGGQALTANVDAAINTIASGQAPAGGQQTAGGRYEEPTLFRVD